MMNAKISTIKIATPAYIAAVFAMIKPDYFFPLELNLQFFSCAEFLRIPLQDGIGNRMIPSSREDIVKSTSSQSETHGKPFDLSMKRCKTTKKEQKNTRSRTMWTTMPWRYRRTSSPQKRRMQKEECFLVIALVHYFAIKFLEFLCVFPHVVSRSSRRPEWAKSPESFEK